MYFSKVHGRFRFALVRFGIKHFSENYCDKLIHKLYQQPALRNSEIGMHELLNLSKEEKRKFLLDIFNTAVENNPEKINAVQEKEKQKIENSNTALTEEKDENFEKHVGNTVIAVELASNLMSIIFGRTASFSSYRIHYNFS